MSSSARGGDLLASASADGAARLWDTSTGTQVAVLKADGNLRKALFSPDGELVLTALNDSTARLWKTDGTEVKFSPDTRSGSPRQPSAPMAGWWPPAPWTELRGFGRSRTAVSSRRASAPARLLTDVAFSPDGKSLVTASRDGTARIWSVDDGAERAVLRGHKGTVTEAAFSPSGLYVVTASPQDRTVRLWSASSGREIAVLAGQENVTNVEPATTHATFNSDGTRIAIVSGDKVAQHHPRLPDAPGTDRLRQDRRAPRTDAVRAQSASSCRSKAMSGNARRNVRAVVSRASRRLTPDTCCGRKRPLRRGRDRAHERLLTTWGLCHARHRGGR